MAYVAIRWIVAMSPALVALRGVHRGVWRVSHFGLCSLLLSQSPMHLPGPGAGPVDLETLFLSSKLWLGLW